MTTYQAQFAELKRFLAANIDVANGNSDTSKAAYFQDLLSAVSGTESAVAFNAKLAQIQHLLAEAYRHYFELSDGYAKSGEGAISIHRPSFFWDEDVENTPSVEIYSYVFGSGRHHSFTDIDEALAQVRTWHAEEMAYDHGSDWGEADG